MDKKLIYALLILKKTSNVMKPNSIGNFVVCNGLFH